MKELVASLYQQRHKCICPNVYIPGWFECDIFSLDAQHRFVEHEIKRSKQDYEADFRKANRKESKHGMLRFHDIRGPSRFWFVCDFDPPSLPEYAGWKTLNGTIKKPAPFLHPMQISLNRMIHVANSLSYRCPRPYEPPRL